MKKNRLLTWIFIFVAIAINACNTKQSSPATSATPQRIVSLAPSITETLFAFGLGSKVVGVTTYCKYPDSALAIEKIGGYADANLEKIVSLKPDLVIGTTEHIVQKQYLQRAGIPVLTVNYSSLDSTQESFLRIGKACGVDNYAIALVAKFRESIGSLDTVINSSRPSVMLCVGRANPGEGVIRSVYIAGMSTIYNEIIEAAGGKNTFIDSLPQYPKLSPEGIMYCNPDIIIDIASAMSNYNCSDLIKDWQGMKNVKAVDRNNIFCIDKGYATVPGPRILLLIQDLKEIIQNSNNSKS
ncbi:MAG TPA: helical backbone metal receptor [Chitinispirillaceae bacterium]|nr:helical backbone metal receptor [Chitinispirillaceae bacterium]